MSTVKPTLRRLRLGPRSAGLLLTTSEFDRAVFREGWRYELVRGVLVVSPTPSRKERTPNDRLGQSLWNYRDQHPEGSSLDSTTPEEEIQTVRQRRRVDRAIWAGLGRSPLANETPTIAVEFVSRGKINQERDSIAKRAEYREIGVREYWIIDRFQRRLTVYAFHDAEDQETIVLEGQKYGTPLLPGFELDVSRILEAADAAVAPGRGRK